MLISIMLFWLGRAFDDALFRTDLLSVVARDLTSRCEPDPLMRQI